MFAPRRRIVVLAIFAVSASLTGAALFPATSGAQADFTVSSETSSTHACSAPVVRWNMLMRFWPQAEGDVSWFGFPSAAALRPAVEESRAEFVTWSDCVVDLTIDGLLKSGSYLPDEDNGASAYAGTYDIVWDVYGSVSYGVGEQGACAQIRPGFPGHAESVELICPSASQTWVPEGVMLTHEWWHEATEHTLPALGVGRPLPDIHKTDDYGYAGPQFVRDASSSPRCSRDSSLPTAASAGPHRRSGRWGRTGPPTSGRWWRWWRRRRKPGAVGLRQGQERLTKHGTAKLTVIVPGPGKVKLKETGKVKGDTERAKRAGNVVVSIRPKPRVKRKMRESVKPVSVAAKVAYTSKSGDSLKGRTLIHLIDSR